MRWSERRTAVRSTFEDDFHTSTPSDARSRPPSLILVSLGRFPMHLVMFDIDGTLTETMKIDEECFMRSLVEVCGFTDVESDWSSYKHATDSGIFHEIHLARTGRPPSVAEISRFRRHFIDLLTEASSEAAFTPIAGARQFLSRLAGSAEHRISLATGGWGDSARLKMASAGMCFDDHPAASADDAHDRESIMRLSKQRAAERYGESFAS